MNDFSNSAANEIAAAQGAIAQATAAAESARDWCLRANTANWESPAAAVFSSWLAELVLTAHRSTNLTSELRGTAATLL